jgi:hypothetical protein
MTWGATEAAKYCCYRELARRAAELDVKFKEKQLSLRECILGGFEAATAPYDTFAEAYNAAYTAVAMRAARQGR